MGSDAPVSALCATFLTSTIVSAGRRPRLVFPMEEDRKEDEDGKIVPRSLKVSTDIHCCLFFLRIVHGRTQQRGRDKARRAPQVIYLINTLSVIA